MKNNIIGNKYNYLDVNKDTVHYKYGNIGEGIKSREEIDKHEIARINQPIDIEWLKSQGLIVEVPDEKKGKTTECGAFDIVEGVIDGNKESVDDKDERID